MFCHPKVCLRIVVLVLADLKLNEERSVQKSIHFSEGSVICQLAVSLKSLFLWSMCDGVKTWVCAVMCLAFVHWSELLFCLSPLK